MKKYYTPIATLIICALVIGGFLSACARETPTPTTTPAPTRTPEPTLTPAPTFTPAPTYTPAPTPTSLPPVSPQVLERVPAPGEEQGLTEPVVVVFDQPMDRPSVERAFEIQPAVAGNFRWPNDTTLAFAPTAPFVRGASYKVILAEGARSAVGLPLKEPFSFRFNTVGYLEVTEVQPAPDTTEVATDALVTVMFNRPVVPLTAISEQTGLPQPLTFDPPVSGEGQWLNTSTYVFRPKSGLTPGTSYTARVEPFEGLDGAALTDEYAWSFSTISPRVVSTDPQDQAIHVNPRTVISTTFNQPMDHASTEGLFSLTELRGQKPIAGEFRWHENTMGFVPAEELSLDTEYVCRLEKGARAAHGTGRTPSDYQWTFTTIKPPAVVHTTPLDGEKDADPSAGIRIQFSSPIDVDTVPPNLTIIPEPTRVYSYWIESDTELVLSYTLEPSTKHTVTLGAGARNPHTREEYLWIPDFLQACRVVLGIVQRDNGV